LGDLQAFMDDVISTVDSVDQLNDTDPSRTVQTFINLVGRHEQAFYSFVYKVHSKGEDLFDSLIKWAEIFISFMGNGTGEEISLEYLLPHTGPAREAIFKEVDTVALHHYKLKVLHEEQVRKRFGNRPQNEVEAAEEEAAQELMNSVIGQMDVGQLMRGDIAELDDDDSEEYTSSEDEEESSAGSETHVTANGRPHAGPLPGSSQRTSSDSSRSSSASAGRTSSLKKLNPLHKRSSSKASNNRRPPTPLTLHKRKKGARPKEPELTAIPELLPIFLELVRPRLQARIPAVQR